MENQLSKKQNKDLGIAKFKDFDELSPLKELLRFIDGLCFKLALPPLESEQVIYLAKFLIKEFKWASMQDIDDAVMKAKAGKLKGIDSKDYNKLNSDFLGRILIAYRTYKGQLKKMKEVDAHVKTNLLEFTKDEPIISFNHIKQVFIDESEKQGGKFNFPDIMLADWTGCYNYLIKEGLMQEKSLEDKIEFAEMVEEDIKQDLIDRRVDEKSIEFKIKIERATSKYAVATECIRRLVRAWFETNKDKL